MESNQSDDVDATFKREDSPSLFDSRRKKLRTLEPVKRPRNLRVRLENVDYNNSSLCSFKSDQFSISVALNKISNSKCANLNWTPAFDAGGNVDVKLTVLRSLIELHIQHCNSCKERLSELDYFDSGTTSDIPLQLSQKIKQQEEEIATLKTQIESQEKEILRMKAALIEVPDNNIVKETIQPHIKETFSLEEQKSHISEHAEKKDIENDIIEDASVDVDKNKATLKLRSFSELERKPDIEEDRIAASEPLVSGDVPPGTFVPLLAGLVTPLPPGSKVMSSNVLRRKAGEVELPPGVYSLVKHNGSTAVVIVKKSDIGTVYKTPLDIYNDEVREALHKQNVKISEAKLCRLATTKWSKMSEETREFYKMKSNETANEYMKCVKEPKGISLPHNPKYLMREDPDLPQGWTRKIFKHNKAKEISVSVCVITPDKVRLYNTEGVRKYLEKHQITDIKASSISFSPWRQGHSRDRIQFVSPSTEEYNTVFEQNKPNLLSRHSDCDGDDPLALDDDDGLGFGSVVVDNSFKTDRTVILRPQAEEQKLFCAERLGAYSRTDSDPYLRVVQEFKVRFPNSPVPSLKAMEQMVKNSNIKSTVVGIVSSDESDRDQEENVQTGEYRKNEGIETNEELFSNFSSLEEIYGSIKYEDN